MDRQLQVHTEVQSQETITTTSTKNLEIAAETGYLTKRIVPDDITKVSVSYSDISRRWYQERSRQAIVGFNVAVSLAAATVVFGIVAAGAVCTRNLSVATATAAVGLTSGVASKRLFKFSDDANKRLDETAKELLDEQ